MKIPNKINVNGVEFSILRVDNLEHDVFGDFKIKEGTVRLDGGLPGSVMEAVFFHEILHLVDFFTETKVSEEDVTRLAWAFYHVLKDNKLLKE
jgi:hypothetical protein